ncbi:MAG: glutathione S-transferase family protein [Thermoleophilaceae bacterium]
MSPATTPGAPAATGISAGKRQHGPPVLWHLEVSHYNEKARWALDYKGIPHVRRAVVPGEHAAIARRLTGGRTFPVLEQDGEAIGDSTRIIEALERLRPEPCLYPADPGERRRALLLEDLFDEELGPHERLLLVHNLLPDAKLFLGTFVPNASRFRRGVARAMYPAVRRRVGKTFGIDELSVKLAWIKCRTAAERFAAELQPNGYLVGDGFTVADLTVAALVSPVVAPVQFPYPQPQREHPLLADLRELLGEFGLDDWAREMYARHRGSSAEVAVQT